MLNWKKKIDDQEEREKAKQQQQKALEEAKKIADKNKFKLFRCHICKTFATKPHRSWNGGEAYSGYGYVSSGSWDIDFSRPDDLWQCSKCNKWTCEEHIYKGICQICAEKM